MDASGISHSVVNLFKLHDVTIDEIGEENMVQVVTESTSAYVRAGEMLMDNRKKLFWNPCTAHILNNMLGDIGKLPVHHDTHKKAKQITFFIYAHAWVLNLMRKYTGLRDLARPGATRFATSYLTLKSIHEKKVELRAMFASREWARSTYAKKPDIISVTRIILGDEGFWQSIKLKSVLPLVKVLRLINGDGTPPMGYIYEAMDRAKEQI
ncbi:uncharacterized protein LOC143883131 [Tasmannia lanceolata]|uniref:uncharacterized protein LOC143883131 n=1 Tax=Tasmannia lanceolata TaxID=3420 RepID=UPI004063B98C